MEVQYTKTVFNVNACYTDLDIQNRLGGVHYTGMSFTENLVRLRNAKGWQQEKLAEVVGVSQVTISRWETGEREPRGKLRAKLADALGVGEAALFDRAYEGGRQGIQLDGAVPVHHIPVLGEVPAGNWREAVKLSRQTMLAPEPEIPPAAYALRVRGDSMDDIVDDGGWIVIDPTDTDLYGGRLYVIRNGDGEMTFKRYREGPARLVPASSNPAHKEMLISGGEFTVHGRVIWYGGRL